MNGARIIHLLEIILMMSAQIGLNFGEIISSVVFFSIKIYHQEMCSYVNAQKIHSASKFMVKFKFPFGNSPYVDLHMVKIDIAAHFE